MLACPLKIKTRHAEDEAEAILTDQGIELRSKYGGALTYSYRDVSDVVAWKKANTLLKYFSGSVREIQER